MTEGIIQKTFNKFRVERLGEYITHDQILTLESRVIEEIKKQCQMNYENEEEYPDMVSRFDLIGDNQ